jgi:nucleoside-diphosphate-sugar epimerase
MKKLLIIGGTGFFGKSILDLFLRGGLEKYGINKIIVAARRVKEFKSKYPELINNNVQLIPLDISYCDSIPKADVIIHAASSTDARDYLNDAKGQKINIETSTINFCEILKKNEINSRVVYCSSGAVYGQQPTDVEAMDEEFPFQDITSMIEYKRDYALAKRNSEKEIIELGKKGFNVAIARCFSFYGKYLPRDQHFAYGNFISDAENGHNIEVKAKGLVYRSYMYADDLVHSLIQIALISESGCPVYNLGSGEAIEIRDLASRISSQNGVNFISASLDKSLPTDKYIPDVSKLEKLNLEFNLNLVHKIINSNPTVILGAGIHRVLSQTSSVFNDWSLLVQRVTKELGVQYNFNKNQLLTYTFEDLIQVIANVYLCTAHEAEGLLKSRIATLLSTDNYDGNVDELKSLIGKLNALQWVSLNVDNVLVDSNSELKLNRSLKESTTKNFGYLNSVPMYFANGNIEKLEHLHFGMRALANQIDRLEESFNSLKRKESETKYDKLKIIKEDETWISRFIYHPVLIVGASIGEHEIGLRYLLNQRKRNFIKHRDYWTPVYCIVDTKMINRQGVRENFETLGIIPIEFKNYKNFWKGVSFL